MPIHITSQLEILNSTHFKDYYLKPLTCYGNLILTLTGRNTLNPAKYIFKMTYKRETICI
jgi:hypothetical protein